MNLLISHPDYAHAAYELMKADPIRGRKQLVECCQIIASVEHLKLGAITMRKSNGELYKKGHTHHPLVINCAESYNQFIMLIDFSLAIGLAVSKINKHASCSSFMDWYNSDTYFNLNRKVYNECTSRDYVLVRKGYLAIRVNLVETYANIMREYMIKDKGMNL